MRYANKSLITKIPKIALISAILLTFAVPTTQCMAGHFTLAFQRKQPAWENAAAPGCPAKDRGSRACRVWVWDENGNPMDNIGLRTTWDTYMGTTDTDGRCEIAFDDDDPKTPPIEFNLVCVDGAGSTSDISYMMTAGIQPCEPRHSYEVGFLYKTDVFNPGTFDTDINCTWPEMYGYCDGSPYTRSLAYGGVDCNDYWSDRSHWGNWQNPSSYFGQTFVATGDRVVAARVQGTIGGNDLLDWKLRIVTFPGLEPVGPATSVPVRFPFGWEAFWGVNDCPVTPGRTYMLQIWRDNGGMNIYHVTKDVYPHGQYYEGTTAFPQFDLNGHICCMNYDFLQFVDFNWDGVVDLKDFCNLAQDWLQDEASADIVPVPFGDGTVNFKDVAVFTEYWLTATKIPPLPGQSSSPDPADGATGVGTSADLSWTAGSGATSHDVYFGPTAPGTFQGNQTSTTFAPGAMDSGATYFWRIDEVNAWGKTMGIVWTFTITAGPPPN